MTSEEYTRKLYEKMYAEQQAYREWLLSQPPSEIIERGGEYFIREDILVTVETEEFSSQDVRALLKSPHPLKDVYEQFLDMETDHMDVIRDAIYDRANAVISAEKAKAARKDR